MHYSWLSRREPSPPPVSRQGLINLLCDAVRPSEGRASARYDNGPIIVQRGCTAHATRVGGKDVPEWLARWAVLGGYVTELPIMPCPERSWPEDRGRVRRGGRLGFGDK